MRLFCLPYAGGMSTVFRSWPQEFPPAIEACAVELPGRGTRISEPRFLRLTALVQAMVKDLLPYLDKPFALFGHSMGAIICFEFARTLALTYGVSPLHLFVAGHSAPHLPDRYEPKHHSSDADLLRYLRELDGTSQAALENTQLMAFLLPIIRADLEISETYTYADSPPLICPITAFGGLEDPEVTIEDLKAWQLHTRSTFRVKTFKGGHFFLQSSKQELIQEICNPLRFLLNQ